MSAHASQAFNTYTTACDCTDSEHLLGTNVPSSEYSWVRKLQGVNWPWSYWPIHSWERIGPGAKRLCICHTTIRRTLSSLSVINEWNKLSQKVVDAPLTNVLKNRLGRHWKDMDVFSWLAIQYIPLLLLLIVYGPVRPITPKTAKDD